MAKKIDYEKWSKDELIKEITRIKSTTYGLVWHRDLPEEKIDVLINPDARTPSEMFPNEMAGKPFPVLKEAKTKAVQTDDSKPVNILIEGDNYHSLAVLSFTHQAAVDVIYIDPPYNTGNNDFKYNDKFVDIEDPFKHSKWLSFMERRLKIARGLLSKSGVIFISIDDNEHAQLRMLCDVIFSESNFVGTITWEKRTKAQNTETAKEMFQSKTEYILVYKNDPDKVRFNLEIAGEKTYDLEDEKGLYRLKKIEEMSALGIRGRETMIFPINGVSPRRGFQWKIGREQVGRYQANDDLVIVEGKPYVKIRPQDENKQKLVPFWSHFFDKDTYGTSEKGKTELTQILGSNEHEFETVKPINLIKKLLFHINNKDAIVLDFFAGSGTTGHAVLEMNAQDKGNRRFILCTNNAELDNNGSKVRHRICSDICYPRVTKVIKGYKNTKGEKVSGLGGNLKYYTTDFVEAGPSDKNKRKLVNESTEMLCIKESAFELVQESEDFKIFKNSDRYLGIIFHEDAINDFKKAIKKIDGHFNTYVFSMTDDPHTATFADIKEKVTLCAIPEVILKVYREVFKHD